MLRQVIQYRTGQFVSVNMEMKFQRISEKYSKRDESGKLIHPLRQSEFELSMKHADEVAKRWM